MFNPQVETMARSEIQALQLKRLQKTVERCYHNSRFYREKMDALSVKPEDIQTLDDVRRLPFTNKTDLRDNYPFGLFSAPMEEIVRVHASSGTTGKPTTVGYTKMILTPGRNARRARWAVQAARKTTWCRFPMDMACSPGAWDCIMGQKD